MAKIQMSVCSVLRFYIISVCVRNKQVKVCFGTKKRRLTEPNDRPKVLFHLTIPLLDLGAVTIN